MGKSSVGYARRRLLSIILFGAIIVFSILTFQTLFGSKHGKDTGLLWMRYLVLWAPLILTAVGLMFVKVPGHRTDQFLYQSSRVLLWLFVAAHLMVIIIQPALPMINEDASTMSLLELVRNASYGLLPAEILIMVLMALMVMKPAGSAAETLEGLPESEQDKIRNAFQPVAQNTRRLIGQNRVEEAFEELLQFCETHDLPQDELLTLKRWWKDNAEERRKNLISNEEANRTEARITNGLLEGIKQIGA